MREAYADREEAGAVLAAALADYRGRHPLVLAIPRGAVPIGKTIATILGGDLDIVLVHKLGAPYSPELAIGAVDESGLTYIAPHAAGMGISDSYIESEKARQLQRLSEHRQRFTPHRAPLDPAGRIVIVVDDGLATGATMIAALQAVRAQQPAELVCAVPVASPDSLQMVAPLADRVVCPLTPDSFMAVGQFYRTFPQVEDEQVAQMLNE